MGLFTSKSYVGLDIGHHNLRAAVVEKTPTGYRIAKIACAPTPPDTVKDGVVIDPAVLGLALKRFLKENHIHATTAAIAVSGASVVVRTARIPKMAESALRKSIKFEASRYVPSSVEESHIEFEILGDVDDGHMEVLVAAAPRDVVDSRVNACEYAGIDAEVVEVAAFATYRALVEANHEQNWGEANIALVDFGGTTTDVSIICKGHFAVIRTIASGGGLLTQALQNYFKLPFEDAESGKKQLDFSTLLSTTPQENPPMRVIQPHLDDIVREIRRSVNYWQSQLSDSASSKQIDALLLCGGASLQPGVAQYFEHKLGIKVKLMGVYNNPRFLGTHHEGETGADIALVTGLGMVFKAKGSGKAVAAPKKAKPIEAVQPEAPTAAPQPEVEPVAAPVVKKRRKKGAAVPEPALAVETHQPTEPTVPTLNEELPHLTVAPAVPQRGFGLFGKKSAVEAVPEVPAELGAVVDELIDAETAATSKPKFSLFGKKSTPVVTGEALSGADITEQPEAAAKPKLSLFGKKVPVVAAETPASDESIEEITATTKPKFSMFRKKGASEEAAPEVPMTVFQEPAEISFSEPAPAAVTTSSPEPEVSDAPAATEPTPSPAWEEVLGAPVVDAPKPELESTVESISGPTKKGFNFFKAKAKEANSSSSDLGVEASATLSPTEEDAA